MNPSECYFWSFSTCELSREQVSFPTFADNLDDAYFGHRLVRNNGIRTCLPKFHTSILCCGQMSSIHCILFRSRMNMIFYFSWFRSICFRFCFICIAFERIKRSAEDCLSSFFTFISSCHLSNFCNGVLISCSAHVINKSLPFVKNHHVILSDLGSHEYLYIKSPFSSFQISNLVLMLPRQRQRSQSSSVNSFSRKFRNFPFNTDSTPSQCLAPSVSRSSCDTLGDASLK